MLKRKLLVGKKSTEQNVTMWGTALLAPNIYLSK